MKINDIDMVAIKECLNEGLPTLKEAVKNLNKAVFNNYDFKHKK